MEGQAILDWIKAKYHVESKKCFKSDSRANDQKIMEIYIDDK